MSRLVIGIGGLKRCGKDELARALRAAAAERSIVLINVAFADALRAAAAAAYGVPVEEFSNDALKDAVHPTWGITRRQMLINLGVPATLLPPAKEAHWVRRWQQSVAALDPGLGVVAADIRRTNEAAAVHQAGGINILVCRPGLVWNGHITEQLSAFATNADRAYTYGDDIDDAGQRASRPVFDLKIFNNGALADLQRKAPDILQAVIHARSKR